MYDKYKYTLNFLCVHACVYVSASVYVCLCVYVKYEHTWVGQRITWELLLSFYDGRISGSNSGFQGNCFISCANQSALKFKKNAFILFDKR